MNDRNAMGRERWAQCTKIANRLGITKNQVHQYLWAEIKSREWVELAIDGNADILTRIRQLPEWAKMEAAPEPGWQPAPEINTSQDQIRTALWFIGKVGGAEKAKKAIDAAIAAMAVMEDEPCQP